MNRRRKVVKGLAAGGLAAWSEHLLAMGNKPLPPGVRRLKGGVFINGATAKMGQLVLAGDTISTGPDGEVVYVMGNNAYLMRESSKVSYSLDGLIGVMRVVTGKVLSVFGPGPKRIETTTATVGIRGTGCYIEAKDESVYFCLCYGTADLVPVGDPAQAKSLVSVYHDTPFTIGRDTSKPLVQPAPVINHRDSELKLLESAVGRWPPFASSSVLGGY